MRTCSIQHRGFTMLEFVTVCGLVIVLTSIAVPSMQSSREASRRVVCKNNLKAHGLALHNYHDIHRGFPPGWVQHYGDAASHAGHGWQATLLPFMDQAPLYQKINRNIPFTEPNELTKLAVERFQCPESLAADVNDLRGGYGNSNYSGNYGSEQIPRWTGGRMEAWWPGGSEVFPRHATHVPLYGTTAETPQGSRRRLPSGVFRWNSMVRIRDIIDGTSNSLLVGERSVNSGAGIWIGVQSNRYENDVVTDASYWSGINNSFTGYSSEHSGGINALLGDGSVRFLSENVDSRPEKGVFQNLADISDGEVIPPSLWK